MCSSLLRRSAAGSAAMLLAMTALLLLSACEESVNPILESDRNFTLWGALDMAADTQFIRVDPIRPRLDPGPPAPLPATVTSLDLGTGDRVNWTDSVITFATGTHAHVFYAPLRVQPGHRYRIEVQPHDSDVLTTVETSVPEAPQPVVLPESVSSMVTGGGIVVRGTQEIRWQGLDEPPFRVDQWYRFVVSERLPFLDVRVPHVPAHSLSPDDPETWRIQLNLAHDRAVLDTMINVRGAALAGLGQQITLVDDAFLPPGGVFNPEVLAEPGTRSNVHNGFGFVGAIGRFRVEWTISELSRQRLNYLGINQLFGGAGPPILDEMRRSLESGPRWWLP